MIKISKTLEINNRNFELTPSQKEKLAKEAINIINRYEFEENKKITTTALRNLLNFATQPNITPNVFILYLKYQIGRARERDIEDFVSDFEKISKRLYKEFNAMNSEEAKMIIIREFLTYIVMGATYRKSTSNKNSIEPF